MSHVEVSVPLGTLGTAFATELDRLLDGVFGWHGTTKVEDIPGEGPSTSRTYQVSAHVTLVLREQPEVMMAGTEDHIGFIVDGRELDRLVAGALDLARHDPHVELRHVDNGRATGADLGPVVFRTFFVRFRLPIWFQFESYDATAVVGTD